MVSGGVGGFPSEISLSLLACDRVFMDIKSMEKALAAGLYKPCAIATMSVDSKRVSAAPWSRANQVCEDPRCNIVQRENSLIMI